MTAVGVARPRAHGHAITRVEIENKKENRKLLFVSPFSMGSTAPLVTAMNQPMNVRTAMIHTAGTKTDDTLSAKACARLCM